MLKKYLKKLYKKYGSMKKAYKKKAWKKIKS
jgi:hypothetical protein